jgi:hypothetical protein
MSPVHILVPDGISVSRLEIWPASANISIGTVGSTMPVGTVPSIPFANLHRIRGIPYNGGECAGYQVDSVGGLIMDFFHMTSPALGLFMVLV